MARKKIEEAEEKIIEGEVVEEKWSISRVVLSIFMAIFLGYFTYIFLHDVSIRVQQKALQVFSQSMNESKKPIPQEVRLPTKNDVSPILQNIEQSALQFYTHNFTSSQNTVNTALKDIQQIKSLQTTISQLLCQFTCR